MSPNPITLDPTSALILVDLQQGITGAMAEQGSAEVVAHAERLAAAFRAHKLPVVLVNVTGGAPGRTAMPRPGGERPANWAELVVAAEPEDVLVTKQTWGAFHNTELDAELRRRGVTQVVVGGIATSMGVESTARAAHEHGYHVTVATDACTDRDRVSHEHSLAHVFPKLGETGTTDEIIALLG